MAQLTFTERLIHQNAGNDTEENGFLHAGLVPGDERCAASLTEKCPLWAGTGSEVDSSVQRRHQRCELEAGAAPQLSAQQPGCSLVRLCPLLVVLQRLPK